MAPESAEPPVDEARAAMRCCDDDVYAFCPVIDLAESYIFYVTSFILLTIAKRLARKGLNPQVSTNPEIAKGRIG
jgi:hypothetical protein